MPLMTLGTGRALFKAPAAVVEDGIWTPEDAFEDDAVLVAWWKADAGVFSDAGSTPAGDNDRIQQWNDQSGNAEHQKQGTANSRPLYETGELNGLPVVTLDPTASGNIKEMLTDAESVALGDDETACFAVVKFTTNAGNNRLLSFLNNADADLGATTGIFAYGPGTTLVNVTAHNNGNKGVSVISTGTWNQIGSVFDGTNHTMYANNVAGTSVSATNTFAANVHFRVGNETIDMQVAEIIWTKGTITSGDRDNIHAYLLDRWGVG
jgi:hypothetical protein